MNKLLPLIGVLTLSAGAPAIIAETLYPTDDLGANKNGNAKTLAANLWDHAWVKFDLTHEQDTIESAFLQLFSDDNAIQNTSIWAASSDNWSQSGSGPDVVGQAWLGGEKLGELETNDEQWLELDVTDFVNQQISGDGLATFEISNDSNVWRHYSSQEGAAPPRLVITRADGIQEPVDTVDPEITIQTSTRSGVAPLEVTAKADVSGNSEIISYHWTLSNGLEFFNAENTLMLELPGHYDLSVTVELENGDRIEQTTEITVVEPADTIIETIAEITLNPVHDTGATGNSNSEFIKTNRWDYAFLEFDIPDIDLQQLESAQLEITLDTNTRTQTRVRIAESGSGNANTLEAVTASTGSGKIAIDVLEILKSQLGNNAQSLLFSLNNDSNSWLAYKSSESDQPPVLHLSVDTEASTPEVDQTEKEPVEMPSMDMPGDMPMSWGNGVAFGPDASTLPRTPGSSTFDIKDTGEKPLGKNPVGAVRNRCAPSHYNYDDPLNFPGQQSTSHLHLFFGNTLADANSTYESLRNSGDSTCRGGTANRTAYWVPTMLTAEGEVVHAELLDVYYKTGYNGTSPPSVQALPDGLRMIAGDAMAVTAQSQAVTNYQCESWSNNRSIPDCTESLTMEVTFPQCWDGKNLDSEDHQSHMAYPSNGCPATHPVVLPVISYKVLYRTEGSSKGWRLSSDMYDGEEMGYSAHADWFDGWDPEIKKTWTQHCLNNSVDCGSHMLGDGRIMY